VQPQERLIQKPTYQPVEALLDYVSENGRDKLQMTAGK
jgi:hypothetical protein